MTAIIVEPRLIEIKSEIHQHLKRQWDDVLAIGQLAIEAKGLIPHGGFENWIRDELRLSKSLIQGYMRVYTRFSNAQSLRVLPVSALLLLASPSVSDGLIMEVGSRIEQGEKFTVEGVDNLIDRYRVLEGAKIGSHTLVKNFGTDEDGNPLKVISRSALTSLEQIADEGLGCGALTINGEDYPVSLALPQSVMVATQQETKRRQSDHIDDNTSTRIRTQATVVQVATDPVTKGYVMIRIQNQSVIDQLKEDQLVTISFEVSS